MKDVTRSEGQPHDDLTRLAGRMIEDVPNDVQAIVMLTKGERNGLVLSGYETDTEAITAMFVHLSAIFEANGKRLLIAPFVGEG